MNKLTKGRRQTCWRRSNEMIVSSMRMAVNMAPRRSNTGELPIYYFQYVIIIDYVLLIARHCFVCICVFDM